MFCVTSRVGCCVYVCIYQIVFGSFCIEFVMYCTVTPLVNCCMYQIVYALWHKCIRFLNASCHPFRRKNRYRVPKIHDINNYSRFQSLSTFKVHKCILHTSGLNRTKSCHYKQTKSTYSKQFQKNKKKGAVLGSRLVNYRG